MLGCYSTLLAIHSSFVAIGGKLPNWPWRRVDIQRGGGGNFSRKGYLHVYYSAKSGKIEFKKQMIHYVYDVQTTRGHCRHRRSGIERESSCSRMSQVLRARAYLASEIGKERVACHLATPHLFYEQPLYC